MVIDAVEARHAPGQNMQVGWMYGRIRSLCFLSVFVMMCRWLDLDPGLLCAYTHEKSNEIGFRFTGEEGGDRDLEQQHVKLQCEAMMRDN